jgi:hypothetical protein
MRLGVIAAAAALMGIAVAPGLAQAHDSFHFGLNVGVPCCGPAYYYPPPYYYYPPPPVVYAPPPAAYAPPPAGYAPPPAGYAPPPAMGAVPQASSAVMPADAVTIREGHDSAGNYCREYQSTSTIDGKQVPTYGTACLRPDGRWQIVN